MAAPDLDAIAAAARDVIDAAGIVIRGRPAAVYDFEPVFFDALPGVAIAGPTHLDRRAPDATEEGAPLGFLAWDMAWRVTCAVQLNEAKQGQADARALLRAVVAAFDADPTLGGVVEDSAATGWELGFTEPDAPQQAVIFRGELQALAFSPV
jgi:hypothetical protein